jgi:hypothetical protein
MCYGAAAALVSARVVRIVTNIWPIIKNIRLFHHVERVGAILPALNRPIMRTAFVFGLVCDQNQAGSIFFMKSFGALSLIIPGYKLP